MVNDGVGCKSLNWLTDSVIDNRGHWLALNNLMVIVTYYILLYNITLLMVNYDLHSPSSTTNNQP